MIHQNKSTSMDIHHAKGFQDPSTYSRYIRGITIVTNFWTPCSFKCRCVCLASQAALLLAPVSVVCPAGPAVGLCRCEKDRRREADRTRPRPAAAFEQFTVYVTLGTGEARLFRGLDHSVT